MEIENFDKLKTDADRDLVERFSQHTTVTINDEGFYTLDILPYTATPNAYLFEE